MNSPMLLVWVFGLIFLLVAVLLIVTSSQKTSKASDRSNHVSGGTPSSTGMFFFGSVGNDTHPRDSHDADGHHDAGGGYGGDAGGGGDGGGGGGGDGGGGGGD